VKQERHQWGLGNFGTEGLTDAAGGGSQFLNENVCCMLWQQTGSMQIA
jgi:hypothetical protein